MFDKENQIEIRAEIVAHLAPEEIDDIMVTALEGGICYWCKAAMPDGDYLGDYASEQISRGGTLRLYDTESDDHWELTLEKFLAGLKMYIENGGADCVVDESIDPARIDADAADSIVQYALFGELMFA